MSSPTTSNNNMNGEGTTSQHQKGFIGIHIGAGIYSKKKFEMYQRLLQVACEQAIDCLKKGGTALKAATIATSILENSTVTNAGAGSNLTWDGAVECDAGIMDGENLSFGAVGCVSQIKNPIVVARSLCMNQNRLEYGRLTPSILVGEGARDYAIEKKIPLIKNEEMICVKSRKRHLKNKGKVLDYKRSCLKRELIEVEFDMIDDDISAWEMTANSIYTKFYERNSNNNGSEILQTLPTSFSTDRRRLYNIASNLDIATPNSNASSTSNPTSTSSPILIVEPSTSNPSRTVELSTSNPLSTAEPSTSHTLSSTRVESSTSNPSRTVELSTSNPTSTSSPLTNVESSTTKPISTRKSLSIVESSTSPTSLSVESSTSNPISTSESLSIVEPSTSKPLSSVESSEKIELNYDKNGLDTVGAVCVDMKGNLASTCSSGGIILKHAGRLGQACMYGAGCWAENSDDINQLGVAVSTSGVGEYLIQTNLAREVANCFKEKNENNSNHMYAQNLDTCMRKRFLESKFLKNVEFKKLAGVIAVLYDPEEKVPEEFLWAHTSHSFFVGFMNTESEKLKVRMSELPVGATPGSTVVVEAARC